VTPYWHSIQRESADRPRLSLREKVVPVVGQAETQRKNPKQTNDLGEHLAEAVSAIISCKPLIFKVLFQA